MKRWVSGFIAAGLVGGFLYFSPIQPVLAVVVILSLMAFREFVQLGLSQVSLLTKVSGAFLAALICIFYLFLPSMSHLAPFLFFLIFFFSCFLFFREKSTFDQRFRDISVFFFGIFYCGLLFAFLGLVRTLDMWPFWLMTLLVVTFMSDTGAYVFGHWIGKHKLAPSLSPGKTVEGFMGGWLFSLIAIFVVRFLFWSEASIVLCLCLASSMAVIGPIGDLSESLIKRAMKVKDSGSFLPGHGGLLDRFDALLFNAPVVYFFAKYLF